MAALIRADQLAGAGAGSDGISRNDLWLSKSITLSDVGSGNTEWFWELVDVPPGADVALSTPAASTTTFTPTVKGTYRVKLTVNMTFGPRSSSFLILRVPNTDTGIVNKLGITLAALGEEDGESNYPGAVDGRGAIGPLEEAIYTLEDYMASGVGVAFGSPIAVGSVNNDGVLVAAARADHQHAHGSLAGGTMHATATTGASGFLAAADKITLNGLPTGASVTLGNSDETLSASRRHRQTTALTTVRTKTIPNGTVEGERRTFNRTTTDKFRLRLINADGSHIAWVNSVGGFELEWDHLLSKWFPLGKGRNRRVLYLEDFGPNVGTGSASADSTALTALISAASADAEAVSIHLSAPSYVLNGTFTVPSALEIDWGSGLFSLQAGARLTFVRPLVTPPLRQLFSLADSTALVEFDCACVLRPEWWGAVTGQLFLPNAQIDANGEAFRHMLRASATYNTKIKEVRLEPAMYCIGGRLDLWSIDPHASWRWTSEGATLSINVSRYDTGIRIGNARTDSTGYDCRFDGVSIQQLAGSQKFGETSTVQASKCNRLTMARATLGGHDWAFEVAGEGANHVILEGINTGNGTASMGRCRYGRRIFTVNAATNECTAVGHRLLTGTPFRMVHSWEAGARLPNVASGDPLWYAITYYAIRVSADVFKVARSRADALAGTAIDLTDTGVGTLRFASIAALSAPKVAVPNATTNLWTSVGHAFVDDAQVRLASGPNVSSATLPTAVGGDLDDNDLYWVEYVDANTFGLRRTAGGARIDLTGVGAGPIWVGTAYEVAGQQWNGWQWYGGKLDDPGQGTYDGVAYSRGPLLDVFANATARIHNHDFSNAGDGAFIIEDSSEISLQGIYTEAVGPGVANTVDVGFIRNSHHWEVSGSRVNGADDLSTNCNVGLRIGGANGAGYPFFAGGAGASQPENSYYAGHGRIGEVVFTRHQLADVYIEEGVDIETITIASTCSCDGESSKRIRIGNATGRLWAGNLAALRQLPPFRGTPEQNMIPSQDFNDWTWSKNSATVSGSTVLAPDGKSQAQVLSFSSTSGNVVLTTIAALGQGQYLDVPMDRDLTSGIVLLRFWAKPIAIVTPGSENVGRWVSYVLRESIGGDPTGNQFNDHEGVWDGSGEWEFYEHRYVIQDGIHNASYPTSTLYKVGFANSNQGGTGTVSVAFWGMELIAVGANDPTPPYGFDVPFTASRTGLVPESDRVALDEAFAGRIRRRGRRITQASGELPAALTYTVPLGLAPAGSRVLAAPIPQAAAIAGGSVATATMDIGSAGDPNAIVAAANVGAAPVDGMCSSAPIGIAPNKVFAVDTVLQAVITATGGNLSTATGGDVSPEVLIWVPRVAVKEPPNAASGCALWLPSDSSAKVYNNERVSSWLDQSGNGCDFSQATDANRPRRYRKHRGRESVLFDGYVSRLTSTKQTKDIYSTTYGHSIYLLLAVDHAAGSYPSGAWSSAAGIIGEDTGFYAVTATQAGLVGISGYNGADNNVRIYDDFPKGVHLVSFRIEIAGATPDNHKMRVDNEAQTTQAVNGLSAGLDVYPLRIGSSYGGGIFPVMRVVEIAAWARYLDDTEDAAVRAYFTEIGGI